MPTTFVDSQKLLVSRGLWDDGVPLTCQGLAWVFVEKREQNGLFRIQSVEGAAV